MVASGRISASISLVEITVLKGSGGRRATRALIPLAISLLAVACDFPERRSPPVGAADGPSVTATAESDSCGQVADRQVAAMNRVLLAIGEEYDEWVRSTSRGDAEETLRALSPNDLSGLRMPRRFAREFARLDQQWEWLERDARSADCGARRMARLRNERAGDITGRSHLAEQFRFTLIQPWRG